MAKSTQEEKIMYIVEHPELLTATKVDLANALKEAGLVAPTTYALDIHPVHLQEEAKKIIAERTKKL